VSFSFPRGYRNCLKFLGEQYPDFLRTWHVNWHNDGALYLIDHINVRDGELDIWINISMLVLNSEDVSKLKFFLEATKKAEVESEIIAYWLKIYDCSIYPELVLAQNQAYKDGEMFFSEYDYNVRTLASVEQFIRQEFGKYRLSVLLEYATNFSGSILGGILLNDRLGAGKTKLKGITGRIIFRMLTQESMWVLLNICQQIRALLRSISSSMQVVFTELFVEVDNGLETFNIGQSIGKNSLSGNCYIEQVA